VHKHTATRLERHGCLDAHGYWPHQTAVSPQRLCCATAIPTLVWCPVGCSDMPPASRPSRRFATPLVRPSRKPNQSPNPRMDSR